MSSESGGRTITARYTSVDSSTGQTISFTVPVNGFLIYVEDGALATYTGNATDANVAAARFSGSLTLPVGGPANRDLGTMKAVSGTINISVIGWR
jgi:hypothetical protein